MPTDLDSTLLVLAHLKGRLTLRADDTLLSFGRHSIDLCRRSTMNRDTRGAIWRRQEPFWFAER